MSTAFQEKLRTWTMVAAGVGALLCGSGMVGTATAQNSGPWGGGDNPAAKQADVDYENYTFRSGEKLDKVRIHYATMGTPHRGKDGEVDNAVLVQHWTGADSRAVLTPLYTKSLYDPGQPLDAQKYYLIFTDNVGHGRSSKPSDGLRTKFPNYGYLDMVDLQHRLVTETLGIKRLHAILGMSMGGMNAWQWAEAYPDAMDGVMPVVTLPIKVSGRNLIWRRMAIDYIKGDPEWNDGNYKGSLRGWTQAYELLRLMIDGVPHMQAIAPDGAGADKFIAEAKAQSAAANPTDVLYSLKSSADYDPEPELGKIKAKLFALNFGDDEFNPDELNLLETLTPRVKNGRYVVQPGSPESFGHLTMAHPELWSKHVAEFMRELGD
ncbi:alpha/beta fold hydrolase [Bradyrhizobium sp. dw_411]|uniref:alpha/beta fold hydrolase n=1 Tax=Bradyrhizobium sp. dw_411 TaxID=2720082 RepID=UPI001BCD6118|nr:alpha/beta fold hydrolase [Bradyrhizobium sp. dw_411]